MAAETTGVTVLWRTPSSAGGRSADFSHSGEPAALPKLPVSVTVIAHDPCESETVAPNGE
jgi:hypothetical protein